MLFEALRPTSAFGWDEKGKFDFIVDIWEVNKSLPLNERVKIILVDTPREFSANHSVEAINESYRKYNRNAYMAKSIESYFAEDGDPRNSFFTVGTLHICKSIKSAGALLLPDFQKIKPILFSRTAPYGQSS